MLPLAAALSACSAPQKDPAVEAYETFVAALRAGAVTAVVERLTPSSRDELARKVEAAEPTVEAIVEKLAIRPGAPFELDLPPSAKVVRGAGTDARTVRGYLGQQAWEVRLQVVDGEWRVDLFDSRPIAPPSAGG